jgi:hypothetical protein
MRESCPIEGGSRGVDGGFLSKAKRDRDSGTASQPPKERPELPSTHAARVITLAGVLLVTLISAVNWAQLRRLERSLDQRLSQIDDRLTGLASRVETSGAGTSRRGPDPNRVYAVKTDGAPVRGPSTAPITIAEFSDFQ